MFGLEWGMPPQAVLARLALQPLDQDHEQVVVGLDSLVARLIDRQAFCPSLFIRLGDACNGKLHLSFVEDGLAGADLRFRFEFEALGKPTDGLSDQAMAAFARVEMQSVIYEFITRYGPPVHTTESYMRWENAHPVGITVFRTVDADSIQLLMGHDGSGVIGAVRYLPPMSGGGGF
ncbi:MAG: hypothetical protein AB8B85_15475 [Paracoccaceae bacterium]